MQERARAHRRGTRDEDRVTRRLRAACLLVAAALAAACATVYEERATEHQLAEVSREVPGLRRPRLVPIHAETSVVAFGLLNEARVNRESPLSTVTQRALEAARRGRRDAVAGGPFPELTDQVLVNALRLSQGDAALAGLSLVVASPAPPSPALAAAARDAKVRLLHRPLR